MKPWKFLGPFIKWTELWFYHKRSFWNQNNQWKQFNSKIPGYISEYTLTPLASKGVGLYINKSLKYLVIEKTEAFQALWIEIKSSQKSNICDIAYRQYDSLQLFQEYFDETLEKLIASNKSVYVIGDFKKSLPHAKKLLLCSGIFTFTAKLFIHTNYQLTNTCA